MFRKTLNHTFFQMGTVPSKQKKTNKNLWVRCPSFPEYGFKYEKSHVLGIPLNTLWDDLCPSYKYMITREAYLQDVDLKTHVDFLYQSKLAFAVLALDEEKLFVSTTAQLESDAYTYIIIACSPQVFGNLMDLKQDRQAEDLFHGTYEANIKPSKCQSSSEEPSVKSS